mgnify:CR=1 FL=1
MKKKAEIMDENTIRRAISRITYEILERNGGAENICVIGILSRGAVLAKRITDKIKELDSALQLQLKTEKDVVNYIMSCLKEENAMDKLQQLEKLEMIKINYLSDNYLDCSQVVMASGDTNESSNKFTNIDKIIIDKLKEDGKYVIGTQKSDVKFSDLENYKKDKIPTINNSQQGTGKLSLVYALRDSVEKGNFGIGDKVDSIIPFK